MENSDSDEQQPEKKKRPPLNSITSPMARHSTSSPDNPTVDASVLQYQNQNLVQQLDGQKHELHDLETKIQELKEKQSFYDSMLISVNALWNELADDLILLGVRAGADPNRLQTLDHLDHFRGSVPSCPAEEVFLCRLLQKESIESTGSDEPFNFAKDAVTARVSSTQKLMNNLEDTICSEIGELQKISQALHGNRSSEDVIIQSSEIDELMKKEASRLRSMIDVLNLKHKDYDERIQSCTRSHSADQSEINRLSAELEEFIGELEESRRKLVNLKMQKDAACGVHSLVACVANGSLSPEKLANRNARLRELNDSIEEIKILADDRLSEFNEAQEDDKILSEQLQSLQEEIKDEKYVHSSRLYTLLNEQLQHWNAQVERYKGLRDSLQAERPSFLRRENELTVKAESLDVSRNATNEAEAKIEELENQLQTCIMERNELEIRMEEVVQDLGREDIKAEFLVMGSALSKELGMVEGQVNRWKETAYEALSLREQCQTLRVQLSEKTSEKERLTDACVEQAEEIKCTKALIEKMQKEKLELQILLDTVGQQIYDNRSIMEVKESEHRACLQAERLRKALDEHGLELRIRAANEAESAYKQRLSAAEAEIADLRGKLDVSERDVFELKEAVKIKEVEAEAYITEIETIGQAYEDMQTQNQRLLQQVTERDDYNLKLVSESVTTKQAQSFLVAEKQELVKHLEQINATLQSVKARIASDEDRMRACITEGVQFSQEDTLLSGKLETVKSELLDVEKETKWLKNTVSSTEKEYEQMQRKMDKIRMELEKERSERNKHDEELKELNVRVAELSAASGEAAIQRLQDEIKDCKAMLKCGVCFDRPKEVVIVKCYHLFCNPCIQRNLEIRHRKCPGCGTAFGQNDVRFVKI